jgi:hypothetical protein
MNGGIEITDEMVEAAAKTMASNWDTLPEDMWLPNHGMAQPDKAEYRAMARTALQAALPLIVEQVAAWLEKQRDDVPACGWEFAATIRNGVDQ